MPQSNLIYTRTLTARTPGPFPVRQRGVSLLEITMVLGFVIVLFTLAVSVLENWRSTELDVFVVEAMRKEAEQDVPVVGEAVRQWYLHEYCGQGAVDNRKPQLPDGKVLACEALPLPPAPRPGLDSFTDAEPDWRNVAPYLPTEKSGLLDKANHGYTWEIYRPVRDPNDTVELVVCEETGMTGLSTCNTRAVPRGPPALIEISWSPPAGTSIEIIEKLAWTTGGTYSPARSVSSQEIANLAGRAIGRTRLPNGRAPEVNASGVECMRQGRSRTRVRFGTVPAVASPEERVRLRDAWGTFWDGSLPVSERPPVFQYNVKVENVDNGDNVIDERDYVLWGC